MVANVDETGMEEARKKPKILLLRSANAGPDAEQSAAAWARLAKALKSFTDFEEQSLDKTLPDASLLPDGCEHLFLDAALVQPDTWKKGPRRENLTLVQAAAAPVGELRGLPATVPLLVLDGFSAGDLLRALHLYLVPMRQTGVAPFMEKGSTILGEKLLDMNGLGQLLDRLAAFFTQVDKFALRDRVPDLRQVLSALLFEAYQWARKTDVAHPAVDFQVSGSASKIVVNLRFPTGGLDVAKLPARLLRGDDLFWSQAWQLSDFTLITHHAQYDEVEVLLALLRPERPPFSQGRSLLFRRLDRSVRKANLLVAPESYQFKLISEIKPKETGDFRAGGITIDSAASELDLSGVPPEVQQKLQELANESRVLSDQLRTKHSLLQESIKKAHETSRELNIKRGEVVRATKMAEAERQAAQKREAELEARNAELRRQMERAATEKKEQNAGASAETVKQLEGMLRAAENEKAQLREGAANEKRKLAVLEQKYGAVFRDNSLKERELAELKAAMLKLRKESSAARAKSEEGGGAGDPAELAAKLKEAEDRESQYKQELKKLGFRAESQEKSFLANQEKANKEIRMLDQKLREAKSKEMELTRKVEELTANLKKAKAA